MARHRGESHMLELSGYIIMDWLYQFVRLICRRPLYPILLVVTLVSCAVIAFAFEYYPLGVGLSGTLILVTLIAIGALAGCPKCANVPFRKSGRIQELTGKTNLEYYCKHCGHSEWRAQVSEDTKT